MSKTSLNSIETILVNLREKRKWRQIAPVHARRNHNYNGLHSKSNENFEKSAKLIADYNTANTSNQEKQT